MFRQISTFVLTAFATGAICASANAQSNLTAKANIVESPRPAVTVESDRTRDGLMGPVRRVRTEIAKLSNESGRTQESKHVVLEVVAYDIKGNKTENQYFPVAGSNLTGKEVYKYDDKGNISEMTLVNDDGSLLSKETYKYEFDFAGNWNKMTTSVAVIESGRMSFEPTEVTYRSIMYYLDENMMRMAQVDAPKPAQPANAVSGNSNMKAMPVAEKVESNSAATVKPKPTTSLPSAAADKFSAGSVELANAKSPSSTSPQVRLDTEPPAAPTPKPLLKPVSGGVLNGTAVSLPPPMYPDVAKRLRTAGVVTVEVVVDETGKVIAAQATSGPSMLREAAVQAALKARFSPTKLSGQPVKVSGLISYKFSLAQ
jgi:TonB family protein